MSLNFTIEKNTKVHHAVKRELCDQSQTKGDENRDQNTPRLVRLNPIEFLQDDNDLKS